MTRAFEMCSSLAACLRTFWFLLLLWQCCRYGSSLEFWVGFSCGSWFGVFFTPAAGCLQGFPHVPCGRVDAFCGRTSFQGTGVKHTVYMSYKYIEKCRTKVDVCRSPVDLHVGGMFVFRGECLELCWMGSDWDGQSWVEGLGAAGAWGAGFGNGPGTAALLHKTKPCF